MSSHMANENAISDAQLKPINLKSHENIKHMIPIQVHIKNNSFMAAPVSLSLVKKAGRQARRNLPPYGKEIHMSKCIG